MGGRQAAPLASGSDRWQAVLITGAVLSFPVLLPGTLGGLHSLIPLPIFYYLIRAGRQQGGLIAGGGLLLSIAFAAAVGARYYAAVPLLMAPLGYVLAKAARKGQSPVRAGMSGVFFLIGILAILGLMETVAGGGNPYAALVGNLQRGLTAAREFYRASTDLPSDTLKEIEAVLAGLEAVLPQILPALLGMTVLGTVWLNLVGGNWLLRKAGKAPWPPYRQWRLPEPMVWGVILGGAALLAPVAQLNLVGLNLLLCLGLLYFFQGLAVLASLLKRWSMPRPLRVALYVVMLIQFYGILVVAIFGLIDVWADFRNRRPTPHYPE